MSSREEDIMADAKIIRRRILGELCTQPSKNTSFLPEKLSYQRYRAFSASMQEKERQLTDDDKYLLQRIINKFHSIINTETSPASQTAAATKEVPYFWQMNEYGLLTMGIDRDTLIDEFERELFKLSRRYDKSANDGYSIAFKICNRVIECIKDERSRLRKQRWFLGKSRRAWFGEPPSVCLLVLIELFNWATDALPCLFDKCMLTSGSEPVISALEKRKVFYGKLVNPCQSIAQELLPDVPGQRKLKSAPYPTVVYVKDLIQKGAANLRANKEREDFVEHIKQLSREMAQAADDCMLSYSALMNNGRDAAPRFVDDDYISPGKEEHGGYPSTLLFRRGIALFRELGIEDLTQRGEPISPEQLRAFEQALAELDDSYLSNPSQESLSAHNTGLDDALFIKDPRAAKDFLRSQGLDPNEFYPGVDLILKPKLALLSAHADNIKHAARLLATARAFCDFTDIRWWCREDWSTYRPIGNTSTEQMEMILLAQKNMEDLRQSSKVLTGSLVSFKRLDEANRLLNQIEGLAKAFSGRAEEVGEGAFRLCRFIPEFKKLCGLSGDWPIGSSLIAQAQPVLVTQQEPPTRQRTLFSSALGLIRRLTGTQAQPAADDQDPSVVDTESQVANTRPDDLSLSGLIKYITQMSPEDERLPAFQLELGCQMMAGILTRLSAGVSVTSNVDNPIPQNESAMVNWLRAAANRDNSRALTVSYGSFWGKSYRTEKYEQLERWLAENLHRVPLHAWLELAEGGQNIRQSVSYGVSESTDGTAVDINELIALLGHHTNPAKRLMIDTLGSCGGFSDQSFRDTRSLAAFMAKLQEFQRHYEDVQKQKSHADNAITTRPVPNYTPRPGVSLAL